MELTTHQTYALFGLLTLAVVLIGIAYCTALKTGREAGHASGWKEGRQAGTNFWRPLLQDIRETSFQQHDHWQERLTQEQLAHQATAAASSALAAELAKLKAAAPLSVEDLATLTHAARQLDVAAHQFVKKGTTKTNQYALAQSKLNELASRLKNPAALDLVPSIDTQLIEWLDEGANFLCDGEHGEFRFQLLGGVDSDATARDVLQLALEQDRQTMRDHGDALAKAQSPDVCAITCA